MKAPEAMEVYLPKPSTAILNIPPHITEVHNPTRINATMATGISAVMKVNEAQSTPGILTIHCSGRKIPNVTSTRVSIDTAAICVRLEIFSATNPPNKRPTSINSQYTATIIPTILGLIPKPGVAAVGAVVRYCMIYVGTPTSIPRYIKIANMPNLK